tara:strand:+ start:2459 stop:2626 length:168 start_codon:yes stop_codon:yes gene_type:complete
MTVFEYSLKHPNIHAKAPGYTVIKVHDSNNSDSLTKNPRTYDGEEIQGNSTEVAE